MAKKQRFTVPGKKLVEKVHELVSRGDVRRVCLIDEEKSILEIPVSTGDPAAPANMLRAPVLAAIKAYSTLVNECTVEVEHTDTPANRGVASPARQTPAYGGGKAVFT